MSTAGGRRLRVAALPVGHPFVRRVVRAEGDDSIDLVTAAPAVVSGESPDPAGDEPDGELRPTGDALDDVDVVHVHFGYDYLEPESIGDVVDRVDTDGVPLVLTVHDIVYPEDGDETPHREHTGTLVDAAARVTTLTRTAAHEIWVRWGADVSVVPHCALLTADEIAAAHAAAQGSDGPRVGVLLERLGENLEGVAALERVAEAVVSRDGATLVAIVEDRSWRAAQDPSHPRHDVVAWLDDAVRGGSVELVTYSVSGWESVHAVVAGLSALVLPYRFGTHSTWLELCRDLGVAPVFAAVGCLREQWFDRAAEDAHAGEVYDADALDELPPAVRAAVDVSLPVPERIRGASTAEVVAAYEAAYREVAG